MTRPHSFSKPSPQSEIDVGWKKEVHGKGPIQLLGQELGDNQDRYSKGPLHRVILSAKGKAKAGHEDSKNQQKGSALKCGSKKLWNALFPSSSVCQQGDRSQSEPLTTERSMPVSDSLPLEDVSVAGTQLVQGCSKEGMTPMKENTEQRNLLRAPFQSKGNEKMRNIAKGEDEAGFKGFVGCSHSESLVMDHISYPATKEKWLNFEGYCGMMEVEIFKVSSHHFSQPSLPFHSPFSGVAPPYPSPSALNLSISGFQSQFPTKNRVLSEIFSKKDDVGAYRHGSVGIPNHDDEVPQLARLNLLSESFNYDKTKPSSPHGAPILGIVSQGDTKFSQMDGFQIEGLSPSKMAKVC